MLAKQLISPSVPALSLTDSADKAIALMEDNHITQLPLLNGDIYLGIVEEEDLLDWDNSFKTFVDAPVSYITPFVMETAHAYVAAKLIKDQQLKILPVLNEQQLYIGCITQETIFNYLSDGIQSKEGGGIIVLQVTQYNLSISQIARIFESEDVNILSILVHNIEDTGMLVTIKTNKQDLRAIVATLERLGYIIDQLHSTINDGQVLKDNFDGLMRYLNI